jgi:hypothetical protein
MSTLERDDTTGHDDWLDAALHEPIAPLPDDGFGTAVMRRVDDLQSRQLAPEIALARMTRRSWRLKHQTRWALYGGVVGMLVMLLAMFGLAPADAAIALDANGITVQLAALLACSMVLGLVLLWDGER